jgi:hypothetical protein
VDWDERSVVAWESEFLVDWDERSVDRRSRSLVDCGSRSGAATGPGKMAAGTGAGAGLLVGRRCARGTEAMTGAVDNVVEGMACVRVM